MDEFVRASMGCTQKKIPLPKMSTKNIAIKSNVNRGYLKTRLSYFEYFYAALNNIKGWR